MRKICLFFSILPLIIAACSKGLTEPNIKLGYELFEDQLMYNAIRFVQKEAGNYAVEKNKCSLIVTKVMEGSVPDRVDIFERETIIPFALNFYDEVLKSEIVKKKELLSGYLTLQVKFYANARWEAVLEFHYPISSFPFLN